MFAASLAWVEPLRQRLANLEVHVGAIRTTALHVARTSFMLLALPVALIACGSGSNADDTSLDADVASTSDIAMSLPALEAMSLAPGTSVIVPLDRSVLALNADALAEVASEGSLEALLEEFVLEEPVGADDVVDGAVFRSKSGLEFVVTVEPDKTSIGAGTLVDVRLQDGITLFVVEGPFES